jgi:ActR/RegA family two-component response regulator
MRCALLDDDRGYCQLLIRDLEARFPALRGNVEVFTAEKQFRERLESAGKFDVDFIILDMMVNWADPSEQVLPAPETVEGGHFRSGLRCLQLIRQWKEEMPVIVQSALGTKVIESIVQAKGLSQSHLSILDKGEDEKLFDCIDNIVHAEKSAAQSRGKHP